MHRDARSSCSHVPGARDPPFCGQCYENRKGRANHQGHRYSHRSQSRSYLSWSEIMDRRKQKPQGNKKEWACPDPSFLKDFPKLAQFLCDGWYSDGKPRSLGSLSFRFDDDYIHGCLTDKDENEGLFSSAGSLMELLEAFESLLASGGGKWKKFKR